MKTNHLAAVAFCASLLSACSTPNAGRSAPALGDLAADGSVVQRVDDAAVLGVFQNLPLTAAQAPPQSLQVSDGYLYNAGVTVYAVRAGQQTDGARVVQALPLRAGAGRSVGPLDESGPVALGLERHVCTGVSGASCTFTASAGKITGCQVADGEPGNGQLCNHTVSVFGR